MQNNKEAPLVSIVMGSESDLPIMKEAADILKEFGISYDIRICSAHRAPEETAELAKTAKDKGVRVIIAGAGGAAHLPGVIAAQTILPVVGVPVPTGALQGEDALLSIVQMPKGIPVATVAIGGAANAGILAAQILASGGAEVNSNLQKKIQNYKEEMRKKVLSKKVQI